ncbi:hypothetical protein LAN30_26920, partial [Mycobacterium tuberculosis]|nr:hypothetical protein [Mycobacterium tuberculosis]
VFTQSPSDGRVSCAETWQIVPNGLLRAIRFMAGRPSGAPREAGAMDPRHRMLLGVAWEALEDAGMPRDSVSGTRAGVRMG